MTLDGRITDALTVLAVQRLALDRSRAGGRLDTDRRAPRPARLPRARRWRRQPARRLPRRPGDRARAASGGGPRARLQRDGVRGLDRDGRRAHRHLHAGDRAPVRGAPDASARRGCCAGPGRRTPRRTSTRPVPPTMGERGRFVWASGRTRGCRPAPRPVLPDGPRHRRGRGHGRRGGGHGRSARAAAHDFARASAPRCASGPIPSSGAVDVGGRCRLEAVRAFAQQVAPVPARGYPRVNGATRLGCDRHRARRDRLGGGLLAEPHARQRRARARAIRPRPRPTGPRRTTAGSSGSPTIDPTTSAWRSARTRRGPRSRPRRGERIVTVTGGLDLWPTDAAIPQADYTDSLAAEGVPFDLLDAAEIRRRWPQWRVDDDVTGLWQASGGLADPFKGNAAHRRLAVARGAKLRPNTRVTALRDAGGGEIEVVTDEATYRTGRLVLAADAWTNQLLASFGRRLPLPGDPEQVTYFACPDPAAFAPDRFPVWIWMDDPSFYGFPTYGEAGPKVAQDCGGQVGRPRAADVRARRVGVRPRRGVRRGPPAGCRRPADLHQDVPLHAHPRPRFRGRPAAGAAGGRRRAGRCAWLQVRVGPRPDRGRARPRRGDPVGRRAGTVPDRSPSLLAADPPTSWLV